MSSTGENTSTRKKVPVWISEETSAALYTIALFCVTEEEGQLVRAILDRRHEAPRDLHTYSGTYYAYGEIDGRHGVHHVVVIRSRKAGKAALMTAAAKDSLKSNFPNLEHAFVIGISGGLSRPGSAKSVYKGDVVVAKSVYGKDAIIEYDLAVMRSSFDAQPKDHADKTTAELDSCFDRWYEDYKDGKNESVQTILESLVERDEEYYAPDAENDFRFLPEQTHRGEQGDCSGCRRFYSGGRARKTQKQGNCYPLRVHRGMVLTGSSLIRSTHERERITSIYPEALCVDMESAVLMDSWHPLIIRGISDYADSHYDYDWVSYASATAAAVAKSIIQTLYTRSARTESEHHRPSFSSGTFSPERVSSIPRYDRSPSLGLVDTGSTSDQTMSITSMSDGTSIGSHARNNSGASSYGTGSVVSEPAKILAPHEEEEVSSISKASMEPDKAIALEQLLVRYAINRSGTNTAKALKLIKKGTKVTSSDDFGNTALHYSVKHHRTELTEALLAKEPSLVARKNKHGETPLHRCVRSLTGTAAEQAYLLIATGKGHPWFAPNEKDDSGKTALEYTVANFPPEEHCMRIFESLLDVGASWTDAATAKHTSYSDVYRRARRAPAPE